MVTAHGDLSTTNADRVHAGKHRRGYAFLFACFSTIAFTRRRRALKLDEAGGVVLVVDALPALHRGDVGTVEREGALAADGDEFV
jgi:hypothetical protein